MDSQGFPTRTTDDVDRGFHNLSAHRAAARRRRRGRRHGLSYWRAAGTTEYSDYLPGARRPGFRELDDDTRGRLSAAARRSAAASPRATSTTRSSRTSRPTTCTTRSRQPRTRSSTATLSAVQSLGAGAMAIREKARAACPTASPCKSDTDAVNLLRAGPHLERAAPRAAGGRLHDHETAGDACDLERRVRIHAARSARCSTDLPATGFRAPDATDRYGYGGNPDLDPERSFNIEAGVRHRFDGAARAVALGVPQRDRRPDRVRRSFPTTRSPGRTATSTVPRIEGIEAAYEYAVGPVAGAGRGDLPGPART